MERSLDVLKKLQATPDGATRSVLAVAVNELFGRIYAGIDIDQEGIARIRQESKEKALVLLPSHESHIDYLISGM
jgi:glycerol-3-phosphate O-acyltransferase